MPADRTDRERRLREAADEGAAEGREHDRMATEEEVRRALADFNARVVAARRRRG